MTIPNLQSTVSEEKECLRSSSATLRNLVRISLRSWLFSATPLRKILVSIVAFFSSAICPHANRSKSSSLRFFRRNETGHHSFLGTVDFQGTGSKSILPRSQANSPARLFTLTTALGSDQPRYQSAASLLPSSKSSNPLLLPFQVFPAPGNSGDV